MMELPVLGAIGPDGTRIYVDETHVRRSLITRFTHFVLTNHQVREPRPNIKNTT